MSHLARRFSILVVIAICLTLSQLPSTGQQENVLSDSPLAKPGTKFNFEVIECFDAKYLGDTVGHLGRGGGLEKIRPHVALGDGVFRGDKKVGRVTSIHWLRVQGSLTIEFDPEPLQRVAVGEKVWIDLNPTHAESE